MSANRPSRQIYREVLADQFVSETSSILVECADGQHVSFSVLRKPGPAEEPSQGLRDAISMLRKHFTDVDIAAAATGRDKFGKHWTQCRTAVLRRGAAIVTACVFAVATTQSGGRDVSSLVIVYIATPSQYRRHGMAKLLVAQLLAMQAQLAEQGPAQWHEPGLYTVVANSAIAKTFWTKCGFCEGKGMATKMAMHEYVNTKFRFKNSSVWALHQANKHCLDLEAAKKHASWRFVQDPQPTIIFDSSMEATVELGPLEPAEPSGVADGNGSEANGHTVPVTATATPGAAAAGTSRTANDPAVQLAVTAKPSSAVESKANGHSVPTTVTSWPSSAQTNPSLLALRAKSMLALPVKAGSPVNKLQTPLSGQNVDNGCDDIDTLPLKRQKTAHPSHEKSQTAKPATCQSVKTSVKLSPEGRQNVLTAANAVGKQQQKASGLMTVNGIPYSKSKPSMPTKQPSSTVSSPTVAAAHQKKMGSTAGKLGQQQHQQQQPAQTAPASQAHVEDMGAVGELANYMHRQILQAGKKRLPADAEAEANTLLLGLIKLGQQKMDMIDCLNKMLQSMRLVPSAIADPAPQPNHSLPAISHNPAPQPDVSNAVNGTPSQFNIANAYLPIDFQQPSLAFAAVQQPINPPNPFFTAPDRVRSNSPPKDPRKQNKGYRLGIVQKGESRVQPEPSASQPPALPEGLYTHDSNAQGADGDTALVERQLEKTAMIEHMPEHTLNNFGVVVKPEPLSEPTGFDAGLVSTAMDTDMPVCGQNGHMPHEAQQQQQQSDALNIDDVGCLQPSYPPPDINPPAVLLCMPNSMPLAVKQEQQVVAQTGVVGNNANEQTQHNQQEAANATLENHNTDTGVSGSLPAQPLLPPQTAADPTQPLQQPTSHAIKQEQLMQQNSTTIPLPHSAAKHQLYSNLGPGPPHSQLHGQHQMQLPQPLQTPSLLHPPLPTSFGQPMPATQPLAMPMTTSLPMPLQPWQPAPQQQSLFMQPPQPSSLLPRLWQPSLPQLGVHSAPPPPPHNIMAPHLSYGMTLQQDAGGLQFARPPIQQPLHQDPVSTAHWQPQLNGVTPPSPRKEDEQRNVPPPPLPDNKPNTPPPLPAASKLNGLGVPASVTQSQGHTQQKQHRHATQALSTGKPPSQHEDTRQQSSPRRGHHSSSQNDNRGHEHSKDRRFKRDASPKRGENAASRRDGHRFSRDKHRTHDRNRRGRHRSRSSSISGSSFSSRSSSSSSSGSGSGSSRSSSSNDSRRSRSSSRDSRRRHATHRSKHGDSRAIVPHSRGRSLDSDRGRHGSSRHSREKNMRRDRHDKNPYALQVYDEEKPLIPERNRYRGNTGGGSLAVVPASSSLKNAMQLITLDDVDDAPPVPQQFKYVSNSGAPPMKPTQPGPNPNPVPKRVEIMGKSFPALGRIVYAHDPVLFAVYQQVTGCGQDVSLPGKSKKASKAKQIKKYEVRKLIEHMKKQSGAEQWDIRQLHGRPEFQVLSEADGDFVYIYKERVVEMACVISGCY